MISIVVNKHFCDTSEDGFAPKFKAFGCNVNCKKWASIFDKDNKEKYYDSILMPRQKYEREVKRCFRRCEPPGMMKSMIAALNPGNMRNVQYNASMRNIVRKKK
jgi:hypothetical protein